MSESEVGPQDGQTPDAPPPVAKAGEMLRQAREAAGLHIGALAVALKVPVKKIEALEADRYEELLDAVFVRALASSICRTLKLDPAPVLALLPAGGPVTLAKPNAVSGTPFRSPQESSAPGLHGQFRRPWVLVVAALLMGALVLYLLPVSQKSSEHTITTTPAASSAAAPATAASTALFPPPGAAITTDQVASSPLAAVMSASAVPAASAVVSLPASSVVMTPLQAASQASGIKGPGVTVDPGLTSGVVVFHTRAESWIEVTDAKGVVVLRRVVRPGESSGVNGALPLSVVVGRSDATEVLVRGKPFDLVPLARDNVARFEVK